MLQFWLQAAPYGDLNGDGIVNFDDYRLVVRIYQGNIWVAKHPWLCDNVYLDGTSDRTTGYTYTVWQNRPVRYDARPDVTGFVWADPNGAQPICSMNHVFFERMFPELVVPDANQPVFVESLGQSDAPPEVVLWQAIATHGGVGEIYSPISQPGYVESRAGGIESLCVNFDHAMDPHSLDRRSIVVTDTATGYQSYPASTQLQGTARLVIRFDPPLPGPGSYIITIGLTARSATGYAIMTDRDIRVTALAGDVDQSGTVDLQDLYEIRTHIGEPLTAANARYDVNRSGSINAQDILAAYANVGRTVPITP